MSKRVLIVDDNADNRLLLCYALNAYDFEIHQAKNGHDTYSLLNQQPFDLAMLDIELPDASGLELGAFIAERHPNTTMVMLSANDSLPLIEQARSLGARAYFVKPFNMRRILDFMRAFDAQTLDTQAEMEVV